MMCVCVRGGWVEVGVDGWMRWDRIGWGGGWAQVIILEMNGDGDWSQALASCRGFIIKYGAA